MDKWKKGYSRYEALKWDLEHGVIFLSHKKEEFEKLKKEFEVKK